VQTNPAEFAQTCEGILEDIRSPLSQTQTKGRTGAGKQAAESDIDDPIAGGQGSQGLGLNEHNFKS